MVRGPTSRQTFAVVAAVSMAGVPIDDVRVAWPRPLHLADDGDLPVPVPEGVNFVVRGTWLSRDRMALAVGGGQVLELVAGQVVDLDVGQVQIAVRLVPQQALRRASPLAMSGSIAVLLSVVLFTTTLQQVSLLERHRCDAAAAVPTMVLVPEAVRNRVALALGVGCESAADNGAGITAEYIARLLKRDFDGEEEGALSEIADENLPTATKEVEEGLWLPAGNDGPKDALGGAEETAPTPVRSAEETRKEQAEAKKDVTEPTEEPEPDALDVPVTPDDEAEAVAPSAPEASDAAEGDAVTDAGFDDDDVPIDEDDEPDEAPAEEREGWGFKDWIDVRVLQRDQAVARAVREDAARQVRIDPDDVNALGVLAYTQYLANDYEAAEQTFDRVIELMPNEAAGYNNKALIYKRRGQWATEEGLYRVALALSPDDYTAINNLAVNLAHQGRYNEALAYMKRLEGVDPDDPYADLHRAKIYASMGEDEQSLYYLERAAAGVWELDTFHHIEFRQDIRLDPSFRKLRGDSRFRAILRRFFKEDP